MVGCALISLLAVPVGVSGQANNFPKVKEYRIERSIPPEGVACIECHRAETPGIFADWARSRHANANITCLDCHLVQPGDEDMAKAKLDQLYSKGLLDKTRYFDEHLELQFYELWHHEGRRARMGAMMMAPDYAWWHGFYGVKSRFNEFNEEADHLLKTGRITLDCPYLKNKQKSRNLLGNGIFLWVEAFLKNEGSS